MIDTVIFKDENVALFERNFLNELNSCEEFKNRRVITSPRSVGDIVQEIAGEKMQACFPKDIISEYSDAFARRAMADVAFSDYQGNYFVVDIKTHNRNTNFNMPNLTSVERLARFYEDDKNYFVILLASYEIKDNIAIFDSVKLIPIEYLKWDCLTIGALGWGQIQIANSNYVNINSDNTRKEWMLQLCDNLDIFYPKELRKIQNRINRFEQVRKFWENK